MNLPVSRNFIRFVECIENNVDTHQRITFANAQELQASMKFFFERAAANIDKAEAFAQKADRLKFVLPIDEKQPNSTNTNLRKALVTEARQQMEDISRKLRENVANCDLAKGTYKFFGELFNIGFIYLSTLNKEIKLLERLVFQNELASECLLLLIQTVKAKVLATTDDESVAYHQMMEAITNAEYNQMINQTSQLSIGSPSRSSHAAGPSRSVTKTLRGIQPTNDRLAVLDSLLDTLTVENLKEAMETISAAKNDIFASDSWRRYFDKLIAKAIDKPDLAGLIAIICHKMSKSTDVWTGANNGECKTYVNEVLAEEIRVCPKALRENAIINFMKMLVYKNYFNVAHIGNILYAATRLEGVSRASSTIILNKVLEIVKSKYTEAKIAKLPEEVSMKVVQIISSDSYNRERAEMFSNYLLGRRQHKSLELDQQKIADFFDNYQTSDSSSDEASDNSSAEFEDEIDETPEEYEENAQKSQEDLKILGTAHKILNELTAEDMETHSFEMVTLVHQNRKKIQMIVSTILEEALSKPENIQLYISLLQSLEKPTGPAKNISQMTTTDCIAKFYKKNFCVTLISGKLTDENNIRKQKVLRLMFELYEGKIVGKTVVLPVIQSILRADNVSDAAVCFAVEFMTKIGSTLEKEERQVKLLFDYVQYAIDTEEKTSFKVVEYTKLMALRKNGWKAPSKNQKSKPVVQNGVDGHKKPLEITLEFNNLDNDDNLYGVVLKLRNILHSEEHVETLVKALLNYNTTDFGQISGAASLIEKLSEVTLKRTNGLSIKLKDIVIDLLTDEFTATNSLKDRDKEAERKLIRMVVIASELFQRNVVTEDSLVPWLLHRQLYHLPIEVLTQISTIISLKNKVMQSKTLIAAFNTLETMIGSISSETFVTMQNDMSLVEKKFETLRKLKAKSQESS